MTAEYILKLATHASELFESSEPQEKRLLLKMSLQNLELGGKNVLSKWIKPFDKIAYYASRQAWLPLVNIFKNREIEFEFSLQNIQTVFDSLKIQPSYSSLL